MDQQIIKEWCIEFKGKKVYFNISPCSWMYPAYGLQVKVSLLSNAPNIASIFLREGTYSEVSAESDAKALVEQHLARSGTRALTTGRKRWEALKAEMVISQKRRDIEAAKERIRYYKEGYRYQFTGWIHRTSGDDYCVVSYSPRKFSAKTIKSLLKNSAVKDDYKVVCLEDTITKDRELVAHADEASAGR